MWRDVEEEVQRDMLARSRSVFVMLVNNDDRIRRPDICGQYIVMTAQEKAFVRALLDHGAFMLRLMWDASRVATPGVAVDDYRMTVSNTLRQ
jgi:hypothetical protein